MELLTKNAEFYTNLQGRILPDKINDKSSEFTLM